MNKKFLSFMSNKDIEEILTNVFKKYREKYKNMSFEEFNKNLIDPFDVIFTIKMTNISIDDWINQEILRQIKKSIANERGFFHEEIIDKAYGFKRYSPGEKGSYSMDIINDKKTIFADIKNKFNTLKGSSKPELFNNFKEVIEKFPNSKAYYVQIISKESKNEPWTFETTKKIINNSKYVKKIGKNKNNQDVYRYYNPNIRIISGDQFYNLVFNNENAFYELVERMPELLDNFMKNHKNILNIKNSSISKQFKNKLKNTNLKSKSDQEYMSIAETTFNNYKNF